MAEIANNAISVQHANNAISVPIRQFQTSVVRKIKTANELHLRKADVFLVQLQETTENARCREVKDTVVLAMDYQKNFLFP